MLNLRPTAIREAGTTSSPSARTADSASTQSRRHWRRATRNADIPGAQVSSTIAGLSSADQRR
jgi:hypothetical protein